MNRLAALFQNEALEGIAFTVFLDHHRYKLDEIEFDVIVWHGEETVADVIVDAFGGVTKEIRHSHPCVEEL